VDEYLWLMRTIWIALALFTSFSAYADSIEDCDILASLEADPNSVSSPVAFNEIQSSSVIYACSKAIEQMTKLSHVFYYKEREDI